MAGRPGRAAGRRRGLTADASIRSQGDGLSLGSLRSHLAKGGVDRGAAADDRLAVEQEPSIVSMEGGESLRVLRRECAPD